MPNMNRDQIRHEVINLQKTLNLLERSFKEEDWTKCTSKDRNNKWLKSQSIIAGVHHCRGVLQNVTPEDYDFGLGDSRSVSGEQFHENAKSLLDRIQQEMIEISQDLSPRPRRPKPILPLLPRLSLPAEKADAGAAQQQHSVNEILIPVDESEMKGQIDTPSSKLLVDPHVSANSETDAPSTLPSRYGNPAVTLLPPSLPPSTALSGEEKTASGSIPGPLQSSTALHDDLSNQLAQMAAQLRRNAEQFNDALSKDDGVLKAAQEKLERNYDEVTKERVRLRDHSVKSSGTTWLVFISVIVVLIAFVMTFLLIRVT